MSVDSYFMVNSDYICKQQYHICLNGDIKLKR